MNSERKSGARGILLLPVILLGTALLGSCIGAADFGCPSTEPDHDLRGVNTNGLEFVPIVAGQAAYAGGSLNDPGLEASYPSINLPNSSEWWLKDGEPVAVHLTDYILSLIDHDDDSQTSECNFCQTCFLPGGGIGIVIVEPIALSVNPASSSSETREVQFSESGQQSGVFACRNRADLLRPIFLPTEDGTYTAGAPEYCPMIPSTGAANIKIHMVGAGRANSAGPFPLTALPQDSATDFIKRFYFSVDEKVVSMTRQWSVNFSPSVRVVKVQVVRGTFIGSEFVMDDTQPMQFNRILITTGCDPADNFRQCRGTENKCLSPSGNCSGNFTPTFNAQDTPTYARLFWIAEFDPQSGTAADLGLTNGKQLGMIFTLE